MTDFGPVPVPAPDSVPQIFLAASPWSTITWWMPGGLGERVPRRVDERAVGIGVRVVRERVEEPAAAPGVDALEERGRRDVAPARVVAGGRGRAGEHGGPGVGGLDRRVRLAEHRGVAGRCRRSAARTGSGWPRSRSATRAPSRGTRRSASWRRTGAAAADGEAGERGRVGRAGSGSCLRTPHGGPTAGCRRAWRRSSGRGRGPRARPCRCCGPSGSSWVRRPGSSSSRSRARSSGRRSRPSRRARVWRSASFIQRMPEPGLNPARSASAGRGRSTGSPSEWSVPPAPLGGRRRSPVAGRNPHAPSTRTERQRAGQDDDGDDDASSTPQRGTSRVSTPRGGALTIGCRCGVRERPKRFDRPTATIDAARAPAKKVPMRALTYHGPFDVRVTDVADPAPFDAEAAVVAVRACGICGSDLHIYEGHGFSPDLGFCVGHEAVGEVVEVGSRGHAGSASATPCSCRARSGARPAVRAGPATSSAASATGPVATGSARCCPGARRRRSRCPAPTATSSRSPTA